MKEELYLWIRNLAVFYIFFTAVLNLIPDQKYGKRSGAFDRKDAGWRSNECGADGQYRSTSHSRRTRARAKTPSKIGN